MCEFVFAGFSYPRTIALPTPLSKLRRKYLPRRATGPYHICPMPVRDRDPCQAWSFYHGGDFAPGLRWVYAEDVDGAGIRHMGWRTNAHGDGDTIHGVVFRLPHGRGFLAGWTMGEGMLTEIYPQVWHSEADAAHYADCAAKDAANAEGNNHAVEATEE